MLRRISQKVYTVILILQFILMGMFLIYAFVQRTQAIKSQELAIYAQNIAEENKKKAIASRVEAEQQAMIARQQRQIAEETLANCKNKK